MIASLLTMVLLTGPKGTAFLPARAIAEREFGSDAAWFEANVPLFECADAEIASIYHYRWRLYKAHLRDLGPKGWLVTEFLDDVGWQRQPYAMLNDATGFHLAEGRWMRDRGPLDAFVGFLYAEGGNDRHFSEGIADATYGYAALAKGDPAFAARYLPAMRHVYGLWDDRFDFTKGLYSIEPLLDATEYTISSIDASGGKDGFRGGDAFRSTINAYQYGNARAISRLAAFVGDAKTAKDYAGRAARLKARVQDALWNGSFEHFTDRYGVDNGFVKYWSFVRGRELEGYVPWAYGLPDDTPRYAAAWRHLLSPQELGGAHGMRTVEPSYEHYLRQYRYLGKQPECQWNGPAWPFQETQVLTGMANLLNDYHQDVVRPRDYVRLLRQYAHQHLLDGRPNLQEDYDPDTGRPIVGLDRSHHYNHSGFADLVITGLCGLRPRADDTLEVSPLVDGTVPWFLLENVPYHGHAVTILWDRDGGHYGKGAGLSVYVDGRRRSRSSGRVALSLGKAIDQRGDAPLDTAVNVARQGLPAPSASSDPEKAIWQAVDGRAWSFPEMVRGWAPEGAGESWFALDYGTPTRVARVSLFPYEGGGTRPPESLAVEAWDGTRWSALAHGGPLRGNTATSIGFPPVTTSRLRVVFRHSAPMRLVEIGTF